MERNKQNTKRHAIENMGSGISISETQVIAIVRRELTRAFEDFDSKRRMVDDYGIMIHETFDEEEKYLEEVRYLKDIELGLKRRHYDFKCCRK